MNSGMPIDSIEFSSKEVGSSGRNSLSGDAGKLLLDVIFIEYLPFMDKLLLRLSPPPLDCIVVYCKRSSLANADDGLDPFCSAAGVDVVMLLMIVSSRLLSSD